MISVDGLSVTYPNGIRALKPTSFTVERGGFVVLLGPSGGGKSTLLRCLNGFVRPTEGRVSVAGIGDIASPAHLRSHRRQTGMVFQHHHLIGRLSALRNVLTGRLGERSGLRTLLPMDAEDKRIALKALHRVGMLDKALTRADQLSGGQRQRVGIARALCQTPRLILADEPVASLDPATAIVVLGLLKEICVGEGITAIVSLHQIDLAQRFADRIIGLSRGVIVADVAATALTPGIIDEIYRDAGPAAQGGGLRPGRPMHPFSASLEIVR